MLVGLMVLIVLIVLMVPLILMLVIGAGAGVDARRRRLLGAQPNIIQRATATKMIPTTRKITLDLDHGPVMLLLTVLRSADE